MKITSTTCDGLKIGAIKDVHSVVKQERDFDLIVSQIVDMNQSRLMLKQMPVIEMLVGNTAREIKVNVLNVSRLDQNEITICENNKEILQFYEELHNLIEKYVHVNPNSGNYEPV